MPPKGIGTARGNCDFSDVSAILSKDRYVEPNGCIGGKFYNRWGR
jgi:hypothetical protein